MNSRQLDLQPTRDLLRRYATIMHHAWGDRRRLDTERKLPHELAFLPANLELTETPPHPAALWTVRVLVGAVIAAVLISALGRLDIVAVAPGQLIPNANVKIIQPAVSGVVRRIWVQNGERLAAGQPVVDLDPTQASADADKARSRHIDDELSIAGARALLIAQEKDTMPDVAVVQGASPQRQADTQNYAGGRFREYREKISSFRAELQKRLSALETTRAEFSKLQQTAPLARQQANDYQDLARSKYVAVNDYLDKERYAIEQSHELAAQQSRLHEVEASIEEQHRDIDTTIAAFRREQWETLNKAGEDAAQTHDEQTKADARQGLMQLRSPVAGVVQQLNIHTVGGVVNSAQPLLEIVPDDTLEVEAHISNKDIGFVHPGQSAIVKLTTFPYARFGFLTGKVIKVSNNASEDKKLGSVFSARIHIPSNQFKVDNTWVTLSPGMEVTAEIKTGTQKVWQYFLSPLIQTGRESLRER